MIVEHTKTKIVIESETNDKGAPNIFGEEEKEFDYFFDNMLCNKKVRYTMEILGDADEDQTRTVA